MSQAAARHDLEMDGISKQLMTAAAQSLEDGRQVSELQEIIAGMASSSSAVRRDHLERRKEDQQRIDTLTNDIAKMDLLHDARVAILQQEMREEKFAAKQAKIDAKEDVQLATLKARSLLQQLEVITSAEAQLEHLKEGRERSAEVSSDQMSASQQEEQKISTELRELRLKMAGLCKEMGDMKEKLEFANLTLGDQDLDRASSSGKGQRPLGPQRTNKPKAQSRKLESIDEEDSLSSLDGTSASGELSNAVDPNAVEEELLDFESDEAPLSDIDALEEECEQPTDMSLAMASSVELRKALADERIAHNELKESVAGRLALSRSQIDRLQEALNSSETERYLVEGKLDNAVKARSVDAAAALQRNSFLQSMLDQVQKQNEDQREVLNKDLKERASLEDEHEMLRQQTAYAMEAKARAESRLEDFKREVEREERKHLARVSKLERDLALAKAELSVRAGEEASAVTASLAIETNAIQEVRDELTCAHQDRSVLVHDMEWKEVHWETSIQNMELNQENTLSELKCEHEQELKNLQREKDERLKQMQDSLDKAREELMEMQSSQPRPRGDSGESPLTSQPAQWWRPSALVAGVKCPSRRPSRTPPASTAQPQENIIDHCQYVCWQVLSLVNDVTALLCSSAGFEILEASKRACAIWGSTSLHGNSLLSLVRSPQRAKWMETKLKETSQSTEVPGFAVKDMQCMEMQSKNGSFDASVVVAHLPEEQGKAPTLVVFFEQLTSPAQSAQPVVRRQYRGTRSSAQSSTLSSVQSMASSSLSVSPSDSVSCVAERLYGK